MPLQNNDLLLVNRNGNSHRYSFENLKRDVLSDIELQLTGLEWVGALPTRPNEISGTPNPATTPRAWNSVTTLLIGVGNDISNVTLGSTLVLTNVTSGNSGTYTVSAVDTGANTITVVYDADTGGDIQVGNTFSVAVFEQFETSSVEIGDTPPVGPDAGDLWFNTDDGRLYIYYTDTDSSQWIDASPDNAANPYWERDDATNTLSPATAGDDVDLGTGDLSAAAGTFSDTITSNVNDSIVLNGTGSNTQVYHIGKTTDGGTLEIKRATTPIVQVAYNGTTTIGGTLPASPNITLSADGFASFRRDNVNVGLPVFKFVGRNNAGDQLSRFQMTVEGNVELKQGASEVTNVFLGVNGTCLKPGGGSWGNTSDARIKEAVTSYSSGLAELNQLQPRSYRYIGNDNTYIGLVAQEAEGAMPELVTQQKGTLPDGTEVDDFRILDMTPLTFALINAVKEMATRIETLEATNASLEARLTALEGGN